MHITITGASGFVGQNLITYLQQQQITTQGVSLRKTDWKKHLDRQTSAIIHLAGKAHDIENTAKEAEYFKINRDLTIKLFNEFLNSDIQDFFYFSSVKAVADTADGVIDENIVPKPLTPYGKSKFEAEQYLLAQSLPKGKRLFIIRPCMIHGPGNKGNLNLLYKLVEKGIPWPLASFNNLRSFLSIDNLSYLIFQMLQNKNIAPGIYNFADDQPISTNQLIQIMNDVLDKNAKFWYISQGLINMVALIGDKINLPLNSERLKKLTENYVVSNEKVKKVLNIKSLPLNSEEGIVETIKHFKK